MRRIPTSKPRLIAPNKMNHINTRLKMSIGWNILIMRRGSDVVSKAQTMKAVLKMHIQQSLIRTIKRNPPFSHSHHSIIITHIRRQDHNATVEQIRPSDIRRSGKSMRDAKKLVRGAVGDDISVDVNYFGELGELPEVDLGEGGVQIAAVHEV